MKRLIVNADDFGLTPGVNTAIVELAEAGALRSTTLMATAAHFSAAVPLAFAQTMLAVGCHVTVVDGSPVLPPTEIPSLIDPKNPGSGQFRSTVGAFAYDLVRGRIRGAEIEAETAAQIHRIQSSGLRVTHIDTHKHTHVFGRVLLPLLRAASACGVPAIRNPFEPVWSMRAAPGKSVLRRLALHALRVRCAFFVRSARENRIATTDGAIGIAATGALDRTALRSLLEKMPDGLWELVCHPGYQDQALEKVRTRLRASREIERQALLEVLPKAVEQDSSLSLIDFGRLG